MPARLCFANALVLSVIVLILTCISESSGAHAESGGNPLEGQRLAANTCSGCHQIDFRFRNSTSDPIPSFQAIAAMPSTTMLSLNVFLRTSHNVMPNIQLTETEISDVGAYILSLRGQSPR